MKHIIYFYKSGCGPCQEVKPLIEEFAKTNEMERINIDEEHPLTDKLNVMYAPTIIVIDETNLDIKRYEGTKKVKDFVNENK